MFSQTFGRKVSSGSLVLFAFAATAATVKAADLDIADARIEGGKLVVSGTAAAGAKLRLDGRLGATAGANGAFAFSAAYVPSDCVISVSSAGASAEAAVANCSVGLTPRGGWSKGADYGAGDLVTHKGATWLARRGSSGKQPAEGADWQLFASGGAADAEAAAKVPPTGPAGGALTGTYPNPQIADGAVTTTKLALGGVTAARIAEGAVTNIRIANSAVNSAKLANNAVVTSKIGSLAVTRPKIADAAVNNSKIAPNSITSIKIVDGAVRTEDILDGDVTSVDILDGTITGADVLDESLSSLDLGVDSVGASEIAADSVGSSEIAPGVVGADELDTVHEHFGPVTNVVDGTAHDGIYATSTSTVSCGAGEDLLSVSIDWTNLAGHGEVVFSGVDSITRGEPDSATVRASFDGGAGPAQYQAVATCIF